MFSSHSSFIFYFGISVREQIYKFDKHYIRKIKSEVHVESKVKKKKVHPYL